ncbi:MAG: hypothetical protein ACOCRK_09420 [bacterium]
MVLKIELTKGNEEISGRKKKTKIVECKNVIDGIDKIIKHENNFINMISSNTFTIYIEKLGDAEIIK